MSHGETAAANQPAADGYTEIPVFDLKSYLGGDRGAERALVREMVHVQENIGFMMVVNHGIAPEIINCARDALERFFTVPMEDKMKLLVDDETSLGYVPIRSTVYVSSTINKNTKKDLNETLLLALERPAGHPSIRAGRRFVGPNKWPDVPGFRDALIAFQGAFVKLGRGLLPLYAQALDLPRNFFAPHFTDPTMWMRNAFYPPVKPEDNQFGISPHSDHSFLTLLPLSDVPGLEILTQEGNWIKAAPRDGGIIVNTGEFFNRWTNGRFIATPHRVVAPDRDRYSIATFFNPNHDTVAAPMVRPGETPKFDPVTMLEYIEYYIDTNYLKQGGGQQTNGAKKG